MSKMVLDKTVGNTNQTLIYLHYIYDYAFRYLLSLHVEYIYFKICYFDYQLNVISTSRYSISLKVVDVVGLGRFSDGSVELYFGRNSAVAAQAPEVGGT